MTAPAPAASPPSRSRWGWIAAGAAAVLLGVLLLNAATSSGGTGTTTSTGSASFSFTGPDWLMELRDDSPAAFWTVLALGWGLFIAGFAFWLWMVVDCLGRGASELRTFTKSGEDDKLIWFGLLLVFNLVAALIYWFAVRRRRRAVPA